MFIAAGEIIPAIEGVSWDDFLQDRFFKPLGMNRTNTSIDKLKGMDNVAVPHIVNRVPSHRDDFLGRRPT